MTPLHRKLLRDIRASKWQYLALVLVLVLGIASFVAMYTSYQSLDDSYNETYERLKFADLTVTVAGAPPTITEDLEAIDGVEEAFGRLSQDISVINPSQPDRVLPARVISTTAPDRPPVNDLLLEEGSYLENSNEVLVVSSFAEAHDLHPGETIH